MHVLRSRKGESHGDKRQIRAQRPSMSSDFAAWAEAHAEALRAGRLDALDLEHLAEEIEDLSNRERDAIESHLETLVMHLLKWRYQPDQRSRSWEATIKVARRNIDEAVPAAARAYGVICRHRSTKFIPMPASGRALRPASPTMLSRTPAPSPWIRSPATGCPEVRHAVRVNRCRREKGLACAASSARIQLLGEPGLDQ